LNNASGTPINARMTYILVALGARPATQPRKNLAAKKSQSRKTGWINGQRAKRVKTECETMDIYWQMERHENAHAGRMMLKKIYRG